MADGRFRRLPAAPALPFDPKPSGSIAGRTIQESVYSPLPPVTHVGDDAPNILIVLIDDAGPGLPTTFGGEVRTDTLDRVCAEGIAYNRFHTTAMCSPTRASLLTGRNHHRVGAGQIAELANDWDGYSGHIPQSSALTAEVLNHYGYSTGAWGKWHNTPAEETTPAGPFHNWPANLGFEYFYGFLAGESSQYEPNLIRNEINVAPPKSPEEGYHLSEDLADDAIGWLRQHKAFDPDRPFYMYWASGCLHGPHHIMREWADRYSGKFDDGWDAYRDRAFHRAKEKGWIPPETQLTPRPASLAAWDDIPEDEKPFQRRLMEVAAGFAEHVDVQVGRLIDEIEDLGYGENTLIFYIWGDNGSSGEGQNGTISELLAQNQIPSTIAMHVAALEDMGGLDVLGSPKTDNMYHAGWAWAGSTPYKGMKLLASHFGGTRNPMAVRWHCGCPLRTGNGSSRALSPVSRSSPRPRLETPRTWSPSRRTCPKPPRGSCMHSTAPGAGLCASSMRESCVTSTTSSSCSAQTLPQGKVRIEVETKYVERKPGGPLDIAMKVDGELLAQGVVPISAPLLFSTDCLDFGICLASPVSLDYYDRAPFPFNGAINRVRVAYT